MVNNTRRKDLANEAGVFSSFVWSHRMLTSFHDRH